MNGPLRISAMATVALGIAAAPTWAQKDEDENEIPFDEASLFFELNDTDGDLGIHSLVDGDAWKRLELEDPNERVLLNIWVTGRLRRQGLTELFFESAEPTFDELPPERFFRRFPEGTYEISGVTLEGDELESAVELSHVMPGPPQGVEISGVPAAANCDVDPLPSVSEPIVIDWDPVTLSHPRIGTPGVTIEVDKYQVVLEAEDSTLTVDLPPEVTELEMPQALTEPGDELKFEIVVREANGNQTAVESCFTVE